MRGALYAATEIVAFLLIATLIGIVIGRLWASVGGGADRKPATSRLPQPQAEPRPKAADDGTAAELAKVTAQLAAAEAERADLRKQLSVAEWQVSTLQDELTDEPDDG